MGYGVGKALVLLQLSLLFVGSFTAEVDDLVNSALPPHAAAHPPHHHRYHHKHHHPPGEAPSHPHPPTEPPTHHHPPAEPPIHHHPPAEAPYHHHHPPAKAPSHHHHHHHHHHHRHPPPEAPSHHHGHHGHPPSHHAPYPPPKHTPPVHPPKPSPPVYHAPPKPAPVYPPKAAPPVYHTPPKYAPVHPPAYPPPGHPRALEEVQVNSAKPTPPAPPPNHPLISAAVAVEGVVYVKSCKYPGVDTLLGASPLFGATVKLEFNATKPVVVETKTDHNGYFFMEAPPTVNIFNVKDCKAFLGPPLWPKYGKPATLNGGASGAVLKFEKIVFAGNWKTYLVYSVGPFAYEPICH